MVGRAGVEPESTSSANTGTCPKHAQPRGAESGALLNDSAPDGPAEPPNDTLHDPCLQAVTAAWPRLPEAVRNQIVATVRFFENSGQSTSKSPSPDETAD